MSSVEQIKAKLNIVDVVGSYLKLEKSGVNYRARCPFHSEKTPSFFVSPSRQTYHCFGCNKGGDLINFVQEIEGLDFIEALKILADQAGVELEPLHRQEKSNNEKLFAVLEEAVKFYQNNLANKQTVLDYLTDRGIKKETQQVFRLGFAADDWRSLYDHLTKKGFSAGEMEKAGLIVVPATATPQASRFYDRFRSRIMFPISSASGRVVGFSGRIFSQSADTVAKYINTPQTALFDKSRLLYGYDRAKLEIKKQDVCVLVEGQIDLLMSHQAGAINTVATSGTALTEEHLRLIKRLTDNLILAYDYDLAGLKASWRAINLARALDLNVKIAKLPDGQDPAEVVQADPQVWLAALTGAKHYIDFLIDALRSQGKSGLDLTLSVNTLVLPYIKALAKNMEQAHFVAKLSEFLSLPEQVIWDDLKKTKMADEITLPDKKGEPIASVSRSRQAMIEDRLIGLLFWQENLSTSAADVKHWCSQLENLLGAPLFVKKREQFEPIKERLILEAELLYQGQENLNREFDDLAANLREELLKKELQAMMIKVREAEKAGDQSLLTDNLKRCQEISQEINKRRNIINKA